MRRQPAAATGGLNLGAIVTPFLDMAFQILAFFIMTYHPSALEGHIPGSLAPPPGGPAVVGDAPLVAGVDVVAQTVAVRVTADDVGAPARLLVKQPTDVDYRPVADERTDLNRVLDQLVARLREIGPAAEDTIKIEGDGRLRQLYVMQVYDAGRRAGFVKVAFVPPTTPR